MACLNLISPHAVKGKALFIALQCFIYEVKLNFYLLLLHYLFTFVKIF